MPAREDRSLRIAAAQPRCTPYAVPENAAAHAAVVAGAAARVVLGTNPLAGTPSEAAA